MNIYFSEEYIEIASINKRLYQFNVSVRPVRLKFATSCQTL